MSNKLLGSFNELSDDEQLLLQALSVIYAPVGQTEFCRLLKQSLFLLPLK
ncbi:MAG: hypothetical protein ACU83U_10320 [Gammaproteobacteria bacterium]